MNTGGWKLLSIILGSFCFVFLIFLGLFGFRLLSFNQIKQNEVNSAVKAQGQQLKKDFQAEKESTVIRYVADDIFGNFSFEYPKVWSTNVIQAEGSDPLLRFLASPNLIVVTNTNSYTQSAIRIEVSNSSYSAKLKTVEGSSNVRNKLLKEEDVTISGTKGKRFSGRTDKVPEKDGSFVLLPLRDKSILIGTDDLALYSKQFQNVLDSFKLSK